MLQPKKQKHRKQFRGQMPGIAYRGAEIAFGEFGRKAITHHAQRGGKVWIRVFPDKPVTKKAPGTRMGSGKGDIDRYVAVVRPGLILFEIAGVSREIAQAAFIRAGSKLPFDVKFVEKN